MLLFWVLGCFIPLAWLLSWGLGRFIPLVWLLFSGHGCFILLAWLVFSSLGRFIPRAWLLFWGPVKGARFLTESGITFEREVVVNFCGEAERRHAPVDFTIYQEWSTDIVECDEDQHSHYTIGCDAGRMLNVFAEILKRGDRAGKLRFIRFNPDAYSLDGEKPKTLQRDRQAALLLVLNTPQQQFSVTYLFYDRTGPLPDVCLDPEYPSTLRAIASAGD